MEWLATSQQGAGTGQHCPIFQGMKARKQLFTVQRAGGVRISCIDKFNTPQPVQALHQCDFASAQRATLIIPNDKADHAWNTTIKLLPKFCSIWYCLRSMLPIQVPAKCVLHSSLTEMIKRVWTANAVCHSAVILRVNRPSDEHW